MTRVFIEGVGLLGPGLNGWHDSRAVLAGEETYTKSDTPAPSADLLPPVERRRTSHSIRLALHVGSEAVANARCAASDVTTVFASSGGSGEVIHQICEALALPEREVSPTRFHNSVHNASAGYWGIATRSQQPSTTVCCFDASFAAGLLEAATQACLDHAPVLLIAHEAPYPEPLHSARPVSSSFAAALVLVGVATKRSLARLDLALDSEPQHETPLAEPHLEQLRANNPAARSLPLLAALALAQRAQVVLNYTPASQLCLELTPC